MPFSDPIVAGKQLIRSAIQSADYIAGVSGWIIERNGNAEFNDATFRGTITGSTIVSDHPTEDKRIRLFEGELEFIRKSDGVVLGDIEAFTTDGTLQIRSGAASDGIYLRVNRAGGGGIILMETLGIATEVDIFTDLMWLLASDELWLQSPAIKIKDNAGIPAQYGEIRRDPTGELVFDSLSNPMILDTDGDADITLQAQGAGGTGLIHLASSRGAVMFELGDGTDYLEVARNNADVTLIRLRNAADNHALRINGVAGNTYIGSTTDTGGTFRVMRASAFTVSSDRKWKRNIRAVPDQLKRAIETLKPQMWEDEDSGKTHMGFIANELPPEVRNDITPEQANGDGTDGAAYNVEAVLALAIAEIQNLKREVELLKAA